MADPRSSQSTTGTGMHWYRIHLSECVLCGRDDGWRERVYGPRPDDLAERYVYEADHACEDHFL